jgi:hypothetical protein
MKRILRLFLLLSAGIVLFSCSDEEIEIGKWDDCIHLSTRSVDFGSHADSVVITTQGSWWWVTDVNVDNLYFYDFKVVDVESDNYRIEQDCFVVERRDKHTLFVKVDANPFNVQRIVTVGLEAGDYFDRVTITQKPK